MPLLSLSRFVAYRRRNALFTPISFSLGPGDRVVITGINGAGKTTLLECIAGLYGDWSGKIQRSLAMLSYLQQAPEDLRTLSLSQIAPLTVGFDKTRYRELLERLQLERLEDRLLALLSGGELQRARLLLALLRRHNVLLLDEPFANVDAPSQAMILDELTRTNAHRATVTVIHPRHGEQVAVKGSVTIELRQSQC